MGEAVYHSPFLFQKHRRRRQSLPRPAASLLKSIRMHALRYAAQLTRFELGE